MNREHLKNLFIIGGNITASIVFLFMFISADSGSATPSQQPTVLGDTSLVAPAYPDLTLTQTANLVNELRKAHGLMALKQNPGLDHIAQQRADNMKSQAYYAHKSPSGVLFNNLMDQEGISYDYACENLNIAEQADAGEFVNSWLASTAGHKECMLKSSNTSAGYAITTIRSKTGIPLDQNVIVAIYSD